MRYVIETTDNDIVEVTNLFDEQGNDTKDKSLASAGVYHGPDGLWYNFPVVSPEMIHTVH